MNIATTRKSKRQPPCKWRRCEKINKRRPPCKWRRCEAAADSQLRTVRTIFDPEVGLEPINVLISVETGESIQKCTTKFNGDPKMSEFRTLKYKSTYLFSSSWYGMLLLNVFYNFPQSEVAFPHIRHHAKARVNEVRFFVWV